MIQMKKKQFLSLLLALSMPLSLTSYASAAENSYASAAENSGEITFQHVPYGIQQVYSIEVVDPVTAVRNPTTPLAGEETAIYVSAKVDSEDFMIRNVTLEWTLNGEAQEPIKMGLVEDVLSLPFAIPGFTADKADQVDLSKVDREVYTCNLPALEKDDVVVYHFQVGDTVSEDYEVTVMAQENYTQMKRNPEKPGLVLEAEDGFQVQMLFGEAGGIHLNTGFGELLPDEQTPEITEHEDGLTAKTADCRVEVVTIRSISVFTMRRMSMLQQLTESRQFLTLPEMLNRFSMTSTATKMISIWALVCSLLIWISVEIRSIFRP